MQWDMHVRHFSSPCPPHTQALLWSTRTQLKWWRRHFNIFIDLWTHFISPKMTLPYLAYILISRFRGTTFLFQSISVLLFLCFSQQLNDMINKYGNSTRLRAACSVCLQIMPVKIDGTIRTHGPVSRFRYFAQQFWRLSNLLQVCVYHPPLHPQFRPLLSY